MSSLNFTWFISSNEEDRIMRSMCVTTATSLLLTTEKSITTKWVFWGVWVNISAKEIWEIHAYNRISCCFCSLHASKIVFEGIIFSSILCFLLSLFVPGIPAVAYNFSLKRFLCCLDLFLFVVEVIFPS